MESTRTRSRNWFCRKIGLRCKTAKLQRIAAIASACFQARNGWLIVIDGKAADPSYGIKPGEIEFTFQWPRIPRRIKTLPPRKGPEKIISRR